MAMADDTRDKVIKLESEFAAFVREAEPRFAKLDEMHALLLKAQGAKWAIFAFAAIGGFIASKVGALLPWFSAFPK